MLYITEADYEKMRSHCVKGLPGEACGLIGGIRQGEHQYVKKVYLLTNVDAGRERFSMDSREQFAAVRDMRAAGLDLLGNFHSHPGTPPRPSEEDIRLAYDSSLLYLIFSMMNREEPVLRAFHIDGEQRVTVEDVRII